jgi:hypothetical protein
MNSSNKINGLVLPAALVEAIHSGRWVVPSDDRLRTVFPLEPTSHAAFFGLDSMERENKGWLDENEEFYLGQKDDSVHPGDIDPAQSVVIADLGPDRLIALDYRPSQEKPTVVYLTGNEQSRWIEVAPDIETILGLLGL